MSRIAVVTDTTQYLPAEVIERHGIHLVSLYVNWDGRTDREIDLPDYDGYYVIEAADLDAALNIAAQIPEAQFGGVEVRPIMEFEGM